jgi:toxin ParE1/3/4
VTTVRFSCLAEADLLAIATYSLRIWGEAQAARYLDEMESCCHMLARNPAIGRICRDIDPILLDPILLRWEHARHVIFSRREPGGILVSRILHRRMLPESQIFEE